MSSLQSRPLVHSGYIAATEASAYASPTGMYTIIDKLTARNSDTTPRSVTFRIVQSGGTAGDSHTVIVKTLHPGETYLFPEMVGQVLSPGDFVSEVASVADKITRRMSGRQRAA